MNPAPVMVRHARWACVTAGEYDRGRGEVVVNDAVVDAVRHLGVNDIQMPCTPERVWRAIHAHDGDAPTPEAAMPHFDEGAPNQAPATGEGAAQ